MGRTVDYYFAPQSPWAYLGHQRLADIAQRTGASLRVMPIDLGGKVFPISGGLPLGQRAPQRQAYRLMELQRFSEHLNAPLNIKPRYFPVGGDDAARVADGSVIEAPAEPYKTAPENPGGKTYDGTGDSSFAVSQGESRPAQLAQGEAAKAGATTLVTISLPTSMAVERARTAGLSLWVLARQDSVIRV